VYLLKVVKATLAETRSVSAINVDKCQEGSKPQGRRLENILCNTIISKCIYRLLLKYNRLPGNVYLMGKKSGKYLIIHKTLRKSSVVHVLFHAMRPSGQESVFYSRHIDGLGR
jgi:hypothetical protein